MWVCVCIDEHMNAFMYTFILFKFQYWHLYKGHHSALCIYILLQEIHFSLYFMMLLAFPSVIFTEFAYICHKITPEICVKSFQIPIQGRQTINKLSHKIYGMFNRIPLTK